MAGLHSSGRECGLVQYQNSGLLHEGELRSINWECRLARCTPLNTPSNRGRAARHPYRNCFSEPDSWMEHSKFLSRPLALGARPAKKAPTGDFFMGSL